MVSYGCLTHYMNLLAKDVEVSGVKEHVVQIIKFFRNGHLPAAWYRAVWKKLEEDLKESHQPPTVMKKLLSCTKQTLTPAHFLANILDPKHQGKHLTDDEIDTAMDYCSEHHPTCLPSVINMRMHTEPFKPYMFKEETVTSVSSLTWRQSQAS